VSVLEGGVPLFSHNRGSDADMFERLHRFTRVLDVGSWVWWAFVAALGFFGLTVSGLMGTAFAFTEDFFKAFGWAGVATVAFATWIIFTLTILMLGVGARLLRSQQAARQTTDAESLAEATAPSSDTTPTAQLEPALKDVGNETPYIKQMALCGPSPDHQLPDRVHVEFAREGKNARFYIEVSWGGKWEYKTGVIYLGEIEHFTTGELKWVPLFSDHKLGDRKYKAWGLEAVNGYNPTQWARGRVIVRFPDGSRERAYFVIPAAIAGVIQPVRWEWFSFRDEWEAKDSR
jgi:hypothetical protein